MRKCPDCGYLVFGDGDACKHCGAPLSPAAAAPPYVAQPLPPVLVTSGAPPQPPLSVPPVLPPFYREGASAAPPAQEPIGREYWTPPTPVVVPSKRAGTPRSLIALISIVSMVLGFVAVNHVFNRNALPSGTSDFVAGRGIPYSSPDHTFDARFPMAPTVQQKPYSTPSGTVTMNLAQVQTDDYELVAASMVLPVSVSGERVDAVLHNILMEGANAQGAKIATETPITRYGATGLEVRAKVKDGYDARLVVLVSGSHVYFLGAHAKRGTVRLYDALMGSLVLY
jgi:hypothetical protein